MYKGIGGREWGLLLRGTEGREGGERELKAWWEWNPAKSELGK